MSFERLLAVSRAHPFSTWTSGRHEPCDGRHSGPSMSTVGGDTVGDISQAPQSITAEVSECEKQSHSYLAGMVFLLRNRHCFWTLMGVEKSQPKTPGKPERHIMK